LLITLTLYSSYIYAGIPVDRTIEGVSTEVKVNKISSSMGIEVENTELYSFIDERPISTYELAHSYTWDYGNVVMP